MRHIILIYFSIFLNSLLFCQEAPYLNNQSYTYDQLVSVYQDLDYKYESAKLIEAGTSDVGKPIHLFVIAQNQEFSSNTAKRSNKTIVLINNGIHAGEVCGIDASVEIAKELLTKSNFSKSLDSVIVLIIPAYNVGGMLNRGAFSRVNQNGPSEYGFRGNAKNLDLNRDFIKCDSKNAKTFTSIFQKWDPDIFIDTHTTNGSDHQYTLTLIATQQNKLNPILSEYMQRKMLPDFYSNMKAEKMEITPYVYSFHENPENGIKDFMETPRYSSGYAALFDCFSFITEAHVFKPFDKRVEQTRAFLTTVIDYAATNTTTIKAIRNKAVMNTLNQSNFTIEWKLDSTNFDTIPFKGYETIKRKSEITDLEMTFYDTNKKFTKAIRYYNSYKTKNTIKKPQFYLLPQAYKLVLERLSWNNVKFIRLKNDSLIEVESSYIKNYQTVQSPYESHYLHYDISTEKKIEKVQFYKGDALIPTDQRSIRYIVECLEAESVDGFFAWNFFDGILQQKEWFSDYAFEPKAKAILEANPFLKIEFEQKKYNEPEFAKNNFQQLYFIYKNSHYYEPTVNRSPVYRIN